MNRRPHRALPFTAFSLLLLLSHNVLAQSAEEGRLTLKFSGYLKNILAYSEPFDFPIGVAMGIPPDSFFNPGKVSIPERWDDLTRLRVKLEGKYAEHWAGEFQGELRGITTHSGAFAMNTLTVGTGQQRWLPMSATMYDEPGYQMVGFVDRAWVRWAPQWGEVITGRQAITWTVGRMWFPMDRFGPFLPFEIEQDEKPGVDAFNVAINLGPLAEFRVIFAPLSPYENDRVGARLRANVLGFDAQIMGGYFSEEYVGGIGFDHALFGALVRAEFAYSHPLDDSPDRWSAIFGMDRSFKHNLYGLFEYYHQSEGETNPKRYFQSFPLYASGALFGLAQDYLGLTGRWTARPEIVFSAISVINLNDGSFLVSPQAQYDYNQNLKIQLAAEFFVPNGDNSEYGLFSNAYYISFKGYF